MSGTSTAIYHYLNNYLGTPQIMTEQGGTVVWEAQYKPFGEAAVHPSSTVENNFRFPGQYYDAETGLHYNYHRYYDPQTGRYLRPDPLNLSQIHIAGQSARSFRSLLSSYLLYQHGLSNPDSLSIYGYVKNNPTNLVDPYGLILGADPSDVIISSPSYDSLRQWHHNRNQYNQTVSYETAKRKWDPSVPADYHQQGIGNKGNVKYVSPDGHSEAIFTEHGLPVTDPVNAPSYNFQDPRSNWIGHFLDDMVPYYLFGNSPDDPVPWYDRPFATYRGDILCEN
jgi:RHS repeat-associated protein